MDHLKYIDLLLESGNTRRELIKLGAKINGDTVTLYRGGDASPAVLRKLRYNDYLSTVKHGDDAVGNAGAGSYGKNIITINLPIKDVEVVNGEVQYRGESESLKSGKKYPLEIYKAYNGYYGSNYTAAEIDKMDSKEVRSAASMGLSDGKEEFDRLTKNKYTPASNR